MTLFKVEFLGNPPRYMVCVRGRVKLSTRSCTNCQFRTIRGRSPYPAPEEICELGKWVVGRRSEYSWATIRIEGPIYTPTKMSNGVRCPKCGTNER